MKKLILIIALCCLPAAAARTRKQQHPAPQQESANSTPTPSPTPRSTRPKPLEVIPEEVFDRELKDLDGRSFYLSNYRGRVFVINVWATWCIPCRRMIPELNRIYNDYRERGVEFVVLTTEKPEEDAKAVRQVTAELEMKYKLGWLDSETAERLLSGRPSIPQTFVVAADGRVVTLFLGYSNNLPPQIRKSIKEALNPSTAAGPRP
ncbi:MAG: TlpA family protein disulfide reductase [Pyrinomonadaceae bacterium]